MTWKMFERPPARSLWDETAPAAPACPALAGNTQAQLVVIGGGYTGLSAALHLAEAGHDVVLLEADTPGWGASGRNGGQVIAGVKHDPEALATLFGAAAGYRFAQAAGGAPDLVFSLIDRLGIACDARRAGWIQLAVSNQTLRVLDERVRQWRALGAEPMLLDAAATRRLTGSTYYTGGMLDPRGGTVQPLAYCRGLAAACRAAGVRLFGQTRAIALAPHGSGWRVGTQLGSVTASQVILATNAYADRLHELLRRGVVAVPSWQVATNPLPEDMRRTILAGGQSASDMRRLLRYFRLDAAGRFVIGARGAYAEPQPASLLAALCRDATRLYPALRGQRFAYQWGGMVAMTRDHLPHLHVLAPGLFAGHGYNGRGVAMATLMGRELAALTLSAEPDLPVTRLRPFRLHATSQLGVRAALAWNRLLDAAG